MSSTANTLPDLLSLATHLADALRRSASSSAESSTTELSDISKLAASISTSLRSLSLLPAPIYDRPLLRVTSHCLSSLSLSLSLARRCRRRRPSVLRCLVPLVSAADLRGASALLASSLADLRWSLSLSSGEPPALTIPPIASTDPTLSWVWSHVSSILRSPSPHQRLDSASALGALASDNPHNKQIIVEEGGVPALLSLLNDPSSIQCQLAAASALETLASSPPGASAILSQPAVPTLVRILHRSPAPLQSRVASIVSRIASTDPTACEDFAHADTVRYLVTLLSHNGSMERESTEVMLSLKVNCAEALWMLSKGSATNSRKIAETKGLLCIARVIEMETGNLLCNCLMTLMEVCLVAESDAFLRRSAFKTNLSVTKLVVDQLLRLVQDIDNPNLQTPAIKSIGSLARTFPAREARVISPLVRQLHHWNNDVSAEAVIALAKFVSPENFLRVEHSRAIVESGAVPPLMRLLKSSETVQLNSLVLLCYLARNAADHDALGQAKALMALKLASRLHVAQDPTIRELLSGAISQLELYQAQFNPHSHT